MREQSTFIELIQACSDGKIKQAGDFAVHAPLFFENERIIAPDSPDGKIFQQHMERITKNLLPDYPLDSQPIHFIITDKADKNAYVLAGCTPPIITFDKSLLGMFKNEDELAYILGHELTHLKLTQELGNGPNSKSEEYIADNRPLLWMHRAGYDVKAAMEFTQREADDPNRKKIDWYDYSDVHGLPEHRAGAVEKSLAALDKYVGGLHYQKRDIPTDLNTACKAAKHLSYLDRRCAEDKYDTLAPLQKLEFINKEVPNFKRGYSKRLKEANTLIRKLDLDPNQDADSKALTASLNILLSNPVAFNLLASEVARQKYGDDRFKPMGKLTKISKPLRALMEAESPQSADKAAKEVLAELSALNYEALHLNNIRWPTFRLPEKAELKACFEEKETYSPPWDDLANAALKIKSEDIAKVLVLMGVPDRRVYDLLSDDFLKKCSNGVIQPLTQPIIPDEKYPGLKFNYEGKIYGFQNETLSSVAFAMVGEEIEARDKRITEAAHPSIGYNNGGKINFLTTAPAEFAANYASYFDQNLDLLAMPENARNQDNQHQKITAREARKLFIKFETHSGILVNKFEELLKLDREKYKDFVREFFLGRGDNRDYHHLTLNVGAMTDTYSRFVTKDKYDLFTIAEKGQILKNITEERELTSDDVIKNWRITLRYQKPDTIEELEDAFKKYREFGEAYSVPELSAAKELQEFVDAKPPGSFSVIGLLKEYSDFIEKAVDSKFNVRFIEHIKAEKNWPTDPAEQIQIYKNLEQCKLFPNEAWRAKYVSGITKNIKAAPTAQEKINLLENLLLGNPIKDVDLRNEATRLWIEANVKLFGKDKGTDTYHKKHDAEFKALAVRVSGNTHIQQRYEMFSKLADALETQSNWSYVLRDHLMEKSRRVMTVSEQRGILSEAFLHQIAGHENLRRDTIEFLIKPLENNSLDKFGSLIEDWERHAGDLHLSKAGLRIEAKRFYDNFWNAPMPARVVMIDELLMPAQDRQQDRTQGTKNYERTLAYVLDQVLPPSMKYAREARIFLESYSNVIPAYQRTLLLSSLMVAGERAAYEGKQCGVGRRLAMILELMGPAERKVGQSVHSHPQTPEDIRVDMARLKSMAAPPARWDLIARYEEVVPQEYRDTVARIGSLKGSASYFVTVGLEKKSGTKTVMALQRANAHMQAKEGFRLLHGLIDELRVKDAQLGEIADTLVEMIQQAETMSDIETNSDIGKRQVELAQGIYNGLKVKVGETNFTFQTAPWLAYGAEFRDQDEMKGVHFSDLPEKTKQEQDYKHDVAKAYIAVELANILKGGVFDHDRHGAQLRVNKKTNHIGLFDHGAMEITPPSEHEKQQLAEALFSGVIAYQKGQPIAEVLYDEIHRLRKETGITPDYLVRVERGMLALSDFFRYITPNDIPDILAGIYKTGQIDPVIQSTLMQMVMGGKIDISSFTSIASQVQPIDITYEPVAIPAPPKRFDTKMTISIPDIEFKNGQINGTNASSNSDIQIPEGESATPWAHKGLKTRSIGTHLKPKTFDDVVKHDPRTLH